MKELLKSMKQNLVSQVQGQISNISQADYKELGAAIDMIKDLEEAAYYCTIVESMEKSEKEEDKRNNTYYYTERYLPVDDYYRDMDKHMGRLYYTNGNGTPSATGSSGQMSSNMGTRYYTDWTMGDMKEYQYPAYMRDSREGRSPLSRRQYMEAKQLHHDKTTQMKDLEKYMQELSSDITEMIEGASPEEKQLLKQKISMLAAKIDSVK